MSSKKPRYRITASPSLLSVSPGAVMNYRLERLDASAPPVENLFITWFCYNDPNSDIAFKRDVVRGTRGAEWRDAEWDFVGHHRIVARVDGIGPKAQDFEYPQHVVPSETLLNNGVPLATYKEDAEAVLHSTENYLAVLKKIEQTHPAPANKVDEYEKHKEQYQNFHKHLKRFLEFNKGEPRYKVKARYINDETQQQHDLRVYLSPITTPNRRIGSWVLVDWTQPGQKQLSGMYRGSGSTDLEGIQNALQTWNADNRYPDGAIKAIVDIPHLGINESVSFKTDNASFLDSISSTLSWISVGAILVAGVCAVAPVPGSRVVSAAIWASVFSSTAASVINIAQNVNNGYDTMEDWGFDALTIIGNLFVGGTMKAMQWVRGATVVTNMQKGIVTTTLIGQVTTDGVQGILIATSSMAEYNAIMEDTSLAPNERVQRLLALFASAATAGLLMYINVKATKLDLANLNAKPKHVKELPPIEKLEQLKDPNAVVNTIEPPKVEGHTAEGKHTTTLQLEHKVEVGSGEKNNKLNKLKYLDSSIPAGSTVHHGTYSTAIGSDSATIGNFQQSTNTGSGHNVIVHGSRPDYDTQGGVFVVDGNPTNSLQIVEALKTNPNYKEGSPVCLGSCWSGSNGTAQEVSNALNVKVTAPTRPVRFDQTTGQWEQMSDAMMMRRHPDMIHIKPEMKVFYPEKN